MQNLIKMKVVIIAMLAAINLCIYSRIQKYALDYGEGPDVYGGEEGVE